MSGVIWHKGRKETHGIPEKTKINAHEMNVGEVNIREENVVHEKQTEVVSWIDTRVGVKNYVINNKRANKQVHMMKASNNKNLCKSYCGFYTFI